MKINTTVLASMFLSVCMLFTLNLFAVKHIVTVGNFFFNPATVNANVGDTIRWVWAAGFHTSTSGTIPAGAAAWNAPITSSNQTFQYKITVAGSYGYHCAIHTTMAGSFSAATPPPLLTAVASATPTSVFAGQNSQLDVVPTGGTGNYSYSWSSNPTGFASAIKSPVVGPSSTTIYTCTVVSGAQTVNPSVTVTVNPVPFITINSPDGGEVYMQGSTNDITWADNIASDVMIDVYKGGSFLQQIAASTPSNGTYSWVIPVAMVPGNDYKIKITSTADNSLSDLSNADFAISSSVPEILSVQNAVTGSGQSNCYNASQTIFIAGSGTSYVVQNGGMATMISGGNIMYLPGTTVASGGIMHGYIVVNGLYCGNPAPPVVSEPVNEALTDIGTAAASFRVFPNPTTGRFTIDFMEDTAHGVNTIEIRDHVGNLVLKTMATGKKTQELCLEKKPSGLYIIRIISAGKIEFAKVIKH